MHLINCKLFVVVNEGSFNLDKLGSTFLNEFLGGGMKGTRQSCSKSQQ